MKTKLFHVKAYRKKDLIKELGLSSGYMFDKITKPHRERIGERLGQYYYPKQVAIILELVQEYKRAVKLAEEYKKAKARQKTKRKTGR